MYAKCFIYFKCFNEHFKLNFWWIFQHAHHCPVERWTIWQLFIFLNLAKFSYKIFFR